MSSPDASLLVVNYHSAALAGQAVQSARAATTRRLEVVIVDNSCDDIEYDRLRGDIQAHELLQPGRNLGFAAGVNLGLTRCSNETVLICNPDVIFRPPSVDLLIERLRGRVVMTGPRFTWDDDGRWLLPPAEISTRGTKAWESAATRFPAVARLRDRRRFRCRLRFWLADQPRRVEAISGAVMAIRREAVGSVGGFDERFPLYFEEIDLMRRLGRAGYEIEHHPGAFCRHLYNQSAGRLQSSPAQYLESERAYHRKWSGSGFLSLMDRAARRGTGQAGPFEVGDPAEPLAIPDPASHYVVEASPLADFDVATGHFPDSPQVRFPGEVWSSYRGESLFLRLIHRRTMRIVRRVRFDKTNKMSD